MASKVGFAVAIAGDMDRDGVSDMLIGAPGEVDAFVFFANRLEDLLFNIVSPLVKFGYSFGAAVAGGRRISIATASVPVLVIGAPLQEEVRGAAYIFNGSDGGLQQTP